MNLKLTWELQSEYSKFLVVMIDGEPWKEVYRSLFQRYLPELSRLSTRELLEERFAFLEKKLCKSECLRLLSIKGRFSKELDEKLKERRFSEEAISYALEECQRLKLIDDDEEGRQLARRLQKKGYGVSVIAAKMRKKGVRYSEEWKEEDPKGAIAKLLEGKLRNRCKEKAIAALCRRGFEYSLILDVLKNQNVL